MAPSKNIALDTLPREKLEDVLDANDLREAIEQETRFHRWEDVKAELQKKRLATK